MDNGDGWHGGDSGNKIIRLEIIAHWINCGCGRQFRSHGEFFTHAFDCPQAQSLAEFLMPGIGFSE